LEIFFGAGWTRYQAFPKQWKVQTPFSESEPDPEQGTINYIHGYVPYKFRKKKDLVLTRESYDAAYSPNGFALRTLQKAVRKYTLLFLGTSFTDIPLRKVLEENRGKQQHFALVKPGTEAAGWVNQLGINPVTVNNYSEISEALKKTYCADLGLEECRRVGLKKPEDYWLRLEKGAVTSRKGK
jgi:hypothetical protein